MSSKGAKTALTAIWAALHTTQYGLAISGLNGIQDAVTCPVSAPESDRLLDAPFAKWLKPCIDLTPAQFGIVVSIFTLGGLIGALSSNALTRPLGRLNTLRLSASCLLVGSAIVFISNFFTIMLIGRVIIGLGCGLATVTVPLYLADIAPPAIRRSLGIMNQLFIVFGILLGQSLSFPFGEAGKWRWVFVIGMIVAVVQLTGSFLVGDGQSKREVGNDSEESRLLGEVEAVEPMSIKELLATSDIKIRRAFYLVLITQISQQTCGISPVMYFSTRILQPVFTGNSRFVALLVVIAKIPLTIVPALIIERVGSRPLLLLPTVFMSVAAVCLALGINQNIPILSGSAIVAFVASFSMGLGPVTWVVMSEVMPKEARTAAGSIGLGVNWTTNFIMGATFLPLQQAMSGGKASGEGNIFYLICGTCLLSFIFIRASYALLARVD